ETELVIVLADRADTHGEAELGAVLGPAVFANEVAQPVRQLADADQRIERHGLRLRRLLRRERQRCGAQEDGGRQTDAEHRTLPGWSAMGLYGRSDGLPVGQGRIAKMNPDRLSNQGRAGPDPAPVWRIAFSISSRSASLRMSVAAAIQPSTCSGERAPTIAAVTCGHAHVHATAIAPAVVP